MLSKLSRTKLPGCGLELNEPGFPTVHSAAIRCVRMKHDEPVRSACMTRDRNLSDFPAFLADAVYQIVLDISLPHGASFGKI
jgi:hypothetical protein